jgi:polysaccharide export outer membrane protein
MKMKRPFCISIAVACCVFGVVQAQQPVTPKPEPASIDTQAEPPYLLGPGDVLEVKIDQMDHPTHRTQVSGDGYVNMALIGRVKAKCRTELQLQQDITTAYDRYIKEPFVTVLVLERNSRTPVSISGAVRQNIKVPATRKLRVNQLIAAAGGFTERAAGTIQILHTEPVMCPEPGHEAEGLPIDGTSIPLQIVKISDLLKGVNNPEIRPGDLVLVTEAEPVYITGSVVSPGSIMMRDDLTLSRALAMVGGTRKEAKASEVRIYRQIAGSKNQDILKVDLAAIKKNEIPDVLLKPYDVIDISDNGPFTGPRLLETLAGILMGGVRNSVPVPRP